MEQAELWNFGMMKGSKLLAIGTHYHRSPLPTLLPPPGTAESTPTDPKNSKDLLAPLTASVTTTELQDEELEEGEIQQTPPTSHHPPLPFIDIQDEEIISTSLTSRDPPPAILISIRSQSINLSLGSYFSLKSPLTSLL